MKQETYNELFPERLRLIETIVKDLGFQDVKIAGTVYTDNPKWTALGGCVVQFIDKGDKYEVILTPALFPEVRKYRTTTGQLSDFYDTGQSAARFTKPRQTEIRDVYFSKVSKWLKKP